jgi:hypothetical protein
LHDNEPTEHQPVTMFPHSCTLPHCHLSTDFEGVMRH